MKLSDFQRFEIKKTLQFSKGKSKILESDTLNGEVNFYSLDKDILEKINKDVISNLSNNEKDEVFLYKILPYLCDIEVDISIGEFEELVKSTNKNFIKFIEIIMTILNDTLSIADSISTIQNTSNIILDKTGKFIENDEDKLNRLYENYGDAKDIKEKRRILKEINKLEEKMGYDG